MRNLCPLLILLVLAGAPAAGADPDAGPNPGGPLGARAGHRNLRAEGGGDATEAAVDRGLDWLAAHQDESGGWFPGESGDDDFATAVTSFALFAFGGAGEDETHPRHGKAIREGFAWLGAMQAESGRFGPGNERLYRLDHAVATLATAEAVWRGDGRTRTKSAKRATAFLLENLDEIDDPGAAVWSFRALNAARAAGIEVPKKVFETLRDRMAKWEAADAKPAGPLFPLSRRACLAGFLICRDHWGDYDIRKAPALPVVMQVLDAEGGPTLGEWGIGTLGVFRVGGDSWKTWNEKMKATLLPRQVTEGPDAGSWNPADFGEKRLGRAGVTAVLTTCLEVYYLYGRVF